MIKIPENFCSDVNFRNSNDFIIKAAEYLVNDTL